MLSATQVEDRVWDWVDDQPGSYSRSSWNAAFELLDNRLRPGGWHDDWVPVEVGDLSVRLVEQFGGEGQGDAAWIVIEVIEPGHEPRLFKVDGDHSSFDGTYYDGDLYEVQPKTVEVIKYERIN